MLTRFSIDMDGSMEPDETGQWVRYEDVVRVHTICGECRGEGEVDTGIGAMDCNVCCGSGIVHQTPLFTAPRRCADVQMLTSEEIVAALHVALPSLSDDSEDAFITGVRVGEKAVRQKAGLP